MATIKNVQAMNNRLDLACRSRVDEFYRQHVSSMAQLENEKLGTARLLQSVKKCPSNYEPLSLKFLGPPPPSRQHHNRQRRTHHVPEQSQDPKQQQQVQQKQKQKKKQKQQKQQDAATADEDTARQQFRQPPQTALPVSSNPFAPLPENFTVEMLHPPVQPPVERSKTIAVVEVSNPDNDTKDSQTQQEKQPRRRAKTPFPNKLERFYSYLEGTKQSCGLSVVDSTQTPEARQFFGTLTRAEWRVKLAKIDPEFFKNMEDSVESLSDEADIQ